MDELQAWRYLAEHREAGLDVGFVEFIDDGDEKVMTAPYDDGGRQFYSIARGASFPECAIKLAEQLQCLVGSQQESGSLTASASDSATSAADGGDSERCAEREVAAEGERTSVGPVTRQESVGTDEG